MTPRYEWVSVHEASRRLNRSVSTIRRQIESGELVGEREPLARGSTRDRYRVRLDVPATSHDATPSESGDEPPDAPETPQDAPAAITGLLEILAETSQAQSSQIAAQGETMERQAETIADLRERTGRAEAERDAARQTAADLAERLRLAEWRWWHRWTKG